MGVPGWNSEVYQSAMLVVGDEWRQLEARLQCHFDLKVGILDHVTNHWFVGLKLQYVYVAEM